MSTHDGPRANADRDGEHEGERVVVRDRRRVDPVTGEVRAPVGEQPAGAPGPAPEPVADAGADSRLAELESQVAERTADLQRVTAEYANYRRRVDRDREGVFAGAKAQVLFELLSVLDDLDRAEQHGDLNGAFKAVADKLTDILTKQGLEPFGAEGEVFDPTQHEAVQHEATDALAPTITVISAVLRRGYRMGDRLLRPAMVIVVDKIDDGSGAGAESPADAASDTRDARDTRDAAGGGADPTSH
ncbi:nucleotide exchange factor GrpE [Pseudonocardia asaccharolytica]|uniref:Protein GrpE n=1 Tax=Pseudonocardia asaccharolytica DSM 44247 = NBRC 16224 TaxID=1123024 RepID=A0A511D0Q4_9PSEU|nr:nucleotide exchange factor GrpE [Pseudonocardia asaccharolytica]GEL18389.1 protein GrpE [Pseudonocardia asaccharolytica DSM 44247 = NBRC 16224]